MRAPRGDQTTSLVVLALLFGLAALAPAIAHAAVAQEGTDVSVAAGTTIDDDLFVAAQTVTIAGRVTGDVYVGAQAVRVSGTVDGDVIAGAQLVTIDGTVGGNVRAAGARVTINGSVARSVSACAQDITISSGGLVGGSVRAA